MSRSSSIVRLLFCWGVLCCVLLLLGCFDVCLGGTGGEGGTADEGVVVTMPAAEEVATGVEGELGR